MYYIFISISPHVFINEVLWHFQLLDFAIKIFILIKEIYKSHNSFFFFFFWKLENMEALVYHERQMLCYSDVSVLTVILNLLM